MDSGFVPSAGRPAARRRIMTGAWALAVAGALPAAGAVLVAAIAGPAPPSLLQQAAGDALPQPTPEELAEYRREAVDSEDPRDWFNLGAALLLSSDRSGASEPLERASVQGEGDVRHRALYDLGLAHALDGREADASPQARRTLLEDARAAFRDALRMDPTDSDARWNLELVERWLENETSGGGGGGGGSAGGGGGAAGGAAGAAGAPLGAGAPSMTREQAEELLEAASRAEREARAERRERRASREPTVTRDW